jgi:glutathione synthase/RimK-type ligase-like ATP-grasp enzyme
MKKIQFFDVLVVYSGLIATSASSSKITDINPFSLESGNDNYNEVYGYFLSECKKNGINAAFSTSSEIIGSGTCKSYWEFDDNKWTKINKKCFAPIIFDKFAPLNKKSTNARKLLFSTGESTPFSDPYLLKLFKDKYRTHEELKSFSIPTVTIEGLSKLDITTALATLKQEKNNHHDSLDFSSQIILKDRNGAGGDHIYKLDSNDISKISTILNDNPLMMFVIQPFVLFDKGYSHNNKLGLADIRLIYFDQKVVQAYIRIAKKDDFRCNEHKGGLLEYIAIKDIPKGVLEKSKNILKKLQTKTSLYALDFIISNNGNTFFLEGNTGPGLDWNTSKKINETKAKHLIKLIVEEFIKRTEINKRKNIITKPLKLPLFSQPYPILKQPII